MRFRCQVEVITNEILFWLQSKAKQNKTKRNELFDSFAWFNYSVKVEKRNLSQLITAIVKIRRMLKFNKKKHYYENNAIVVRNQQISFESKNQKQFFDE